MQPAVTYSAGVDIEYGSKLHAGEPAGEPVDEVVDA
jgi:hypothetical protein